MGTKRNPKYVPRPRLGMREGVKNRNKKAVAAFMGMASGHGPTASYLTEKLKKDVSSQCPWCGGPDTRQHLLKSCKRWKEQIRKLWREIAGILKVPVPKAKKMAIVEVFRRDELTGVLMDFFESTKVGRWTDRPP